MCRMAKHALPTDESEQRAPKRPSSGDEAMTYRPVRRPQKNNEWWSVSENYFAAMDHDTQVKWSHIGRIMETAQGRQMDAPCERCRENSTECWAYSDDPVNDDAGFGCAECRLRQDWQESCTLNVNNTLRQQLEGLDIKKVTPVIMKPPASTQQVTALEEQNKNIQEENTGLKQRLEELEAKQDATQKMLHAISCTVE
ncbi:uncharacterized protein J3D65DRAFT_102576 [Phyllosticta citribraziliensis]|uniref:Uncharacterized protein n=1 Tax=Phyllosticta citribraziliensis TaxID=989973 RepID=A0ABR1LAR8_9PEZI